MPLLVGQERAAWPPSAVPAPAHHGLCGPPSAVCGPQRDGPRLRGLSAPSRSRVCPSGLRGLEVGPAVVGVLDVLVPLRAEAL